MINLLRLPLAGALLWVVFIAPPATILALLNASPFHAWWLASLLFLPVPILLLLGVFRSGSRGFRWWVFQYLGVSALGFSAAVGGAVLSLFVNASLAGQIAVLLFAVFVAMAVAAAHRIHLVPLDIVSAKITRPLRLIQISDVHIGSRQPAFLRKVMTQVAAQKPDMLLITGDLVDENVSAETLLPLAGLDYPVFYSSGNHERYVDYQKTLDILSAHGVTVLRDTTMVINELHILGVEDRQRVQHAEEALDTLCSDTPSTDAAFRILLYHQPDLWAQAVHHGIDLMLAGHTHKGQIWPFGWLVRTRYKHVAGHFRSALSHLFVSQGTGTWGPILRFGTRCEMTVIELRPEESS